MIIIMGTALIAADISKIVIVVWIPETGSFTHIWIHTVPIAAETMITAIAARSSIASRILLFLTVMTGFIYG